MNRILAFIDQHFIAFTAGAVLLAALVIASALSACSSTPIEVAHIDEMSQEEFDALVADVTEPIPIALGIALDHGKLDAADLVEAAAAIEAIASAELEPVKGGPISSALKSAGFTDNEVLAVFYAIEKALDRHGIKLGPVFGERTRALLHAVAEAVTHATPSDAREDS